MSGGSALEEPGRSSFNGGSEKRDGGGDAGPSTPARGRSEERLIRLLEEFRRRQRERPDMVVRPWWASGGAGATPTREVREDRESRRGAVGFVVEYCPHGIDSVEIAVRPDRARLEGPGGMRQTSLDLAAGWRLDGSDVRCPELLANHLLSIADRLLGEAA